MLPQVKVLVLKGATDSMFSSLDSHGGHIVVAFGLIIVGIGCNLSGMMNGDHMIDFALGVMARSMYGSTVRGANGVDKGPPAVV